MRSDNPVTRLVDAVWRPTSASMRWLALAGVAGNAVIMSTGAAVRVSGSGLGCPTWPKCTGDSLVPSHSPEHAAVNMAIEFGNRLLTFMVLAVGVAVFVAAVRLSPRRRDLVRLAAVQPLSVVAQAVVGGIVVLTDLNPAAVTAHFLLSPALLAAATALWIRASEGDAPAHRLVRAELVWLARALIGVVVVLLVAGTVVTGTGPHAGDAKAPRFGFRIEQVAQLHADVVWATVGLTFALLLGLRLTNAPRRAQRCALELLVVELAQGVIGYVQYFTGVPGPLVVLHVLGSALVWIATLRVAFALRERGPVPATTPRAVRESGPEPRLQVSPEGDPAPTGRAR
ncbi:COX15/CtaA family protein [Actinoallomurus iriomotensis]|uniref:Cytochrome b561 n=1 Tax=Actinoallomurus iriomotensis TaxID=478107 RepID=A0A9W6VXG6_9ACTN|nr:cytochrome b561 [Actinoallomurus iriomotensis]